MKFVIIFILTVGTLACSINSNKGKQAATWSDICREFEIPVKQTYRLKGNYLSYLFSLDTARQGAAIQNHYQPMQALYYNKQGQLVSFHANCYAGIGKNDEDPFVWNQKSAFDRFPPISIAPLDSLFPLSKHLEFLEPIEINPIDSGSYDYTIIVHWTKSWRHSDSKQLINVVKKNVALAKDLKIKVLYVNTDSSSFESRN